MKCPRCSHEWEPRAAKREARRTIEDREIDRVLGVGDGPEPESFGGLRGVLPGRNFVGRTSGSDDWDESEIIGER
jgi:hypothetical protein